jgi:hydroxymethylpyrimidine kinase/phosphomethylpyrimidine kinase/thiamine-phosphate diphosphorylase
MVIDPVWRSGTGTTLTEETARAILIRDLFPRARLVTPNLPEAEALLQEPIRQAADVPRAAQAILRLGPRECLLKGGHAGGETADDYWTDGRRHAWLRSWRRALRTHGTGCVLSSAIAAGLAEGRESLDAIVRAKAVLNRGLRLAAQGGPAYPIPLPPWPLATDPADLPRIGDEPAGAFPDCGDRLGFYPIVPRAEGIDGLIARGATAIQLRIKDLSGGALEREVERAVRIAGAGRCRLFVNDYAELAVRFGAYGVHLGQEDLDGVDREWLLASGVRLGISTHNYFEIARAATWRPSYLAIGPIFPTRLKAMPHPPQGMAGLRTWRGLVTPRLVAVGGLRLEHAADLVAAGADGVAVIGDWTNAPRPLDRARDWVTAYSAAARSAARS